MSQAVNQSTLERSTTADVRGAVIGAVVLAALVLVLFFDFFRRQMVWAIEEQADWGHTLVIPLIAGYFVYLKRDRLLERPFKTTWFGFVPILLGMAVYTVSAIGPEVLSHHNLRGVGVALTVVGLVLLFCGFRAMAVLWFPLLYVFVFGQTISYRVMELLTFTLQDITAFGAHIVLVVFGVDAELQGNTIIMYDEGVPKPLNIAEACSGMRMLMAFLALGVAMAYTGLHRNWQRAIVIFMGVPTAIFVNILRVVSLAMLALIDTDFAAGNFHSFVGLIWLLPAFLMYLGVIWLVRHLVVEERPAA